MRILGQLYFDSRFPFIGGKPLSLEKRLTKGRCLCLSSYPAKKRLLKIPFARIGSHHLRNSASLIFVSRRYYKNVDSWYLFRELFFFSIGVSTIFPFLVETWLWCEAFGARVFSSSAVWPPSSPHLLPFSISQLRLFCRLEKQWVVLDFVILKITFSFVIKALHCRINLGNRSKLLWEEKTNARWQLIGC